jgi:hypothetical protein
MLDMLMTKEPSLDELWETAESGDGIFVPRRAAGLPEAARRGTDRFEPEGEVIRVRIDEARYR